MPQHAEVRSAPINIRALNVQRSLIDRAAAVTHKNRSDFMLEVSCLAAEQVLLDQRLFFVDEGRYKAFLASLEQPVLENKAIQKLLSKKSPWERDAHRKDTRTAHRKA